MRLILTMKLLPSNEQPPDYDKDSANDYEIEIFFTTICGGQGVIISGSGVPSYLNGEIFA